MSTLFPAPVGEQTAKRPKVIIWKWTLIATALFLTYFLWECGSGFYQGGRHANEAVRRFHQELNSGKYEQICQEAAEGFREKDKHDELIKLLQAVHTKLGDVKAESFGNITVNAGTDGTFIVTSYSSTFERGMAEETFTWLKRAGGLELYTYHIESNAFVEQ
jgi:hypothetical protein